MASTNKQLNDVHVGIDTGGTFTDCILTKKGEEPIIIKVHSTPVNPAEAIINGIERLCDIAGISIGEIGSLTHGTTVATNAMLQEQWAKVGLITTKGFRDVLEIGTQMRPELYKLQQKKVTPLVPRNLRMEIDERIDMSGNKVKEINVDEVYELVKKAISNDIESLAVSLLFSYTNPEHEELIKKVAQELAPELYVGLSSEVSPEFREYNRTSTTVINAALTPVVRNYLQYLQRELHKRGFKCNLNIMQSNGGIVTGETEVPAHKIILSGPAGGIVAASENAAKEGFKNALTFDMGGTSSDIGIIVNDEPQVVEGTTINGAYPLQTPTLDIHTIGAGGGSIGWKDSGGSLKVGPNSAGAYPGPACYGKGGDKPTITDANLFLGHLDPKHFLGGELEVYPEKSRESLQMLADELTLDIERTAQGILDVANSNMAGALRVVSSQRGHDPRDFALIAFGGAGPLHAASLAKELGMKHVIIPSTPGILSAHGLLLSDVRHDLMEAKVVAIEDADVISIEKGFISLEAKGEKWLKEGGLHPENMHLNRSIDLRYKGQEYYLSVPLEGEVSTNSLEKATKNFHEVHKNTYGHAAVGEPVEIVNLRVSALGEVERINEESLKKELRCSSEPLEEKHVHFNGHGWVKTPVYNRENLTLNTQLKGATVITQMDTTVIVEPSQSVRIDEQGNLIITLED